MSLLLEELIKQAEQLSKEERLQLISRIAEGLINTETLSSSTKEYSITDFRGIGADLLDGVDAGTWVARLRDEWIEREQGLKES
jgi:hypothetical protein